MVKLNHRQRHVLWATVRHYVATAEPVGSKALVEEYNLRVSPATIRNAMGSLEKSGLLYQPHISAGRIPSDSGYRIYVDRLMKPSEDLASQVDQLLTEQLNWKSWSLEALLRGAAHILSNLGGCITLITMPQAMTTQLRHLQLVQVDPGQVMLIVVLDAYQTHSTLMQLPEAIDDVPADAEALDQELQILSNFLNTHLRGRSLSDIKTLDWRELGREFERYADFLKSIMVELAHCCKLPASSQILMSGLAEVLRQPEFSESHQIQTIVQLLEEQQEQLWPLIFELSAEAQTESKALIRIGSENPLKSMHAFTLVSSIYRRGSIPIGSVGFLGPTRMLYDNAVAMVEAAADYLSDALTQAA
ncbi:MAG: heat-inducible transcriptional repressor HrcA [Cyanothece sp. SIO1E1]|nr:heat-inducible transcriptional repressor HrcA [Cyanothece sp. SIO1E1]